MKTESSSDSPMTLANVYLAYKLTSKSLVFFG
nr:MAG TPA: hypothetical protein [Caudoviricetes sp.]